MILFLFFFSIVGDLDAVLITYPDIEHMGALPYLVGKLGNKTNSTNKQKVNKIKLIGSLIEILFFLCTGLTCPIYCTLPVYKMGQMFLYDAFQCLSEFGFDTFNLDDIDLTFEKIHQLKYSQDISLQTKSEEEIIFTPICAGHIIGGSVWKIKKLDETIIYAIDYNHARDRHLDGFVLEAIGAEHK
jgi:cleavage and polyadenylation specificity factor subunit 2